MKNCYLVIILIVVVTLLGCRRRPMEEEVGVVAQVPIKIDWSQSSLDVKEIHRATVRVFPHDGSPAYDFRMQKNVQQDVIPLPIGKYSMIIFNETTDDEDWKSLVFSGTDSYDKFVVSTRGDTFKGLYTKADQDIVRKTPEAFASWSIDQFEVTENMIHYTRALSKGELTKAQFAPEAMKAVEQQLDKVLKIVPVSIVKKLNIKVRVQNLSSASKASGAIKGATQGVQLSTREPIPGVVTHVFILNGRVYDDPTKPKDGTIGASMMVFDVKNADDLKCELLMDFLLSDNTQAKTEIFDITKEIKKESVEIDIRVGFEVDDRPDDRPIVLPPMEIGSQEPSVDDWDEVIVPLGKVPNNMN